MKTLSSLNLLLALCVPCGWASAAPGSVDPTYDTGVIRLVTTPESVVGATKLSDGSVLVARSGSPFSSGQGQIIKILPDGRQDFGFVIDPKFRYAGYPGLLSEVSPGRLLVSGAYQPSGFGQGMVAAFDSKGRWDTNYPGERPSLWLNTILIGLPSGGVLLGRQLGESALISPPPALVVELDAEGRTSETFRSNLQAPGNVVGMRRLPDGRTLIAGYFTPPGQTVGQSLGRLLPDGTWDESFELPNGWPSESATGLWPAADGGNWVAVRHRLSGTVKLYRIPTDGELKSPSELWLGDPKQTQIGAVLDDGAGGVWVGGRQLVRLLPDGQIDPSVRPPQLAGDETSIRVLLRLSDDSVFVGGLFSELVLSPGQTVKRPGFFRWLPDGPVDLNYGRLGFSYLTAVSAPDIHVAMSDGTFIVGGRWQRFNGAPVGSLSRITDTGARDSSFVLDRTRFPGVLSVAELGSGGLLIGSTSLIPVNGQATSPLVWLTPAGELRSVPNVVGTVLALERMPDGSVVAAGRFAAIPVNVSPSLRRVNLDGQMDPTWSIDLAIAQIRTDNRILLRAQDHERLLVGLTASGEVRRYRMDGTLDPEFEAKPAELVFSDFPLRDLAVSDDGSILAVGLFYVGKDRVSALRWHPDGSRDRLFRSAIPEESSEVEPSGLGRFVVAGGQRMRPVRILPDGALDPTFAAPTNLIGFEGLASSGFNVYGLGNFVEGKAPQSSYRLIRLENASYTLAPPEPTAQGVRLRLVAPAGESHVVEISRTLRDWTPVSALVMPTNRLVEWLLPPQFTQDVQFFRDRRLD